LAEALEVGFGRATDGTVPGVQRVAGLTSRPTSSIAATWKPGELDVAMVFQSYAL